MDLRVRQALAHAINKPALDETLFGGHRAVTDSFLAPSTPCYADVDKAITKYPYDVRRAELLMEQAGFNRGASGLVGPDGQPLLLDFWGDAGGAFERELAAIADGWRQAGIETRQRVLSVVETRDGELRNTFPALYSTATGTGTENNLGTYTTSGIPTPANRWIGGNRSAWSHAEYDALWERFNSTLDRAERNRQAVEMARLLSQELPNIMLWHNFHVVAYLSSLRGPDTRGIRDLTVWNVHEWMML
jgi:peptide/nickel transport system substrate-binding protein